MRFLPSTRQVQLAESSPEKLIEASKGTYFYRSGNDIFFIIDKTGKRTKVAIPRKTFALKYYNQPWYETIADYLIVFEKTYELWQKTGNGYNSIGWTFVSNKSLSVTVGEPLPYISPTPTSTPTPTATPTATATPTPTATPTATEVPPPTTPTPTATPTPTPTATEVPPPTTPTPTATPTATIGVGSGVVFVTYE